MKRKQCGLGRANYFSGVLEFALPRLISRPQEGSGEECGRVSDWGFSEKIFVPVKLARSQEILNFKSGKFDQH